MSFRFIEGFASSDSTARLEYDNDGLSTSEWSTIIDYYHGGTNHNWPPILFRGSASTEFQIGGRHSNGENLGQAGNGFSSFHWWVNQPRGWWTILWRRSGGVDQLRVSRVGAPPQKSLPVTEADGERTTVHSYTPTVVWIGCNGEFQTQYWRHGVGLVKIFNAPLTLEELWEENKYETPLARNASRCWLCLNHAGDAIGHDFSPSARRPTNTPSSLSVRSAPHPVNQGGGPNHDPLMVRQWDESHVRHFLVPLTLLLRGGGTGGGGDVLIEATLQADANLAGELDVERGLTGDVQADADLTASLAVDRDLQGGLAIDADLAGSLDEDRGLEGALAADADLSGSLSVDRDLQGAVSLDAELDGNLAVDRDLAGVLTVDADLAGDLEVSNENEVTLASILAIETELAAELALERDLAASLAADQEISGVLAVDRGLEGAVAVDADLSGDLEVGADVTLAAVLACDVAIAGDLRLERSLAGALAVDFDASGAVSVDRALAATLSVDADLAGDIDARTFYQHVKNVWHDLGLYDTWA